MYASAATIAHLLRGRRTHISRQPHICEAYGEQKNWNLVRKVIAYDRCCTREGYAALAAVYKLLCCRDDQKT